MRRLFVVVALVGCARGSAPAWPKQHLADRDGGESIAPRQPRQASVAIERSEDPKPVVPKPIVVPAPAITGGTEPPAPAITAPAVPPTEETITTEDIVIDIDD